MNWIEEVDLTNVAPNDQEELKTYLGNYKSLGEALVGGKNHKKMVGAPYRLPESIDKLPENIREEFRTKARSVLGIESSVTEDTLKEVNFAKGLLEGTEPNETAANKIKELAVSKNFTKSQVQDLVEMMNTSGTELKAAIEKETQANFREVVDASHKVLSEYYGEEKLKTESENLRKAFQNNLGLSKEEYEQVSADFMDDGWIFRHPQVAKVLIDNFAKLSKEGETTPGNRNEPTKKDTVHSKYPKTATALGW